jgi:hypothetical protein
MLIPQPQSLVDDAEGPVMPAQSMGYIIGKKLWFKELTSFIIVSRHPCPSLWREAVISIF